MKVSFFPVLLELKVASRTPEKGSAASLVTCGAVPGAELGCAQGNTAPPWPGFELHSRVRRSAEQSRRCAAPLTGWQHTHNAVLLIELSL